MSGTVGIALTVFLLAANAFFVGAEFALVSARRSQIEPQAQAGSRMARTLRPKRCAASADLKASSCTSANREPKA